jgi:hypothetical protein
MPRNSTDWSQDGRYIIEHVLAKTNEIWVLPLFGDRKAFPYLQGDYNQSRGKLSPNGRWLAYQADEYKRDEVYIRSFATPARKWHVSMDGGSYPIWSRDGKELFFIAADGKMMAADVTESGGRFSPGVPKALFDAGLLPGASFYDVAKDGRWLSIDVSRTTKSGGEREVAAVRRPNGKVIVPGVEGEGVGRPTLEIVNPDVVQPGLRHLNTGRHRVSVGRNPWLHHPRRCAYHASLLARPIDPRQLRRSKATSICWNVGHHAGLRGRK